MANVTSIINILDTLNKIGSSKLGEVQKFAIATELKADLPAPQLCPTSNNTLSIVANEIEEFLNGKRQFFAEEEKKPTKRVSKKASTKSTKK
tara:strand:- start:244 stop:519 length:276 start_codon:yes stop_codon:yes gene_type:complete